MAQFNTDSEIRPLGSIKFHYMGKELESKMQQFSTIKSIKLTSFDTFLPQIHLIISQVTNDHIFDVL
jgi:hypothetical protein